MRKIAISDIHGCVGSFEALLDRVALTTADELYLLGDYIDRGPGSKEVIDKVFRLREQGHAVHCLRGNHEEAFVIAAYDDDFLYSWSRGWGGEQTLESFGIDSPRHVSDAYWEFIRSLGYVLEVDEYILVHAGLNFMQTNPLKRGEDMLLIRNWYEFIDYDWLGNRIIVHGHTPIQRSLMEELLANLDSQRVLNIDGGCFAKHLPGKGYLCAFDMTNRLLYFQKNLDDVSGYWKGIA